MARIQIVPLPPASQAWRTYTGFQDSEPFMVLIDQIATDDFGGTGLPHDIVTDLQYGTGARLVLMVEGTLDAEQYLALTQEERDTLAKRVAARIEPREAQFTWR